MAEELELQLASLTQADLELIEEHAGIDALNAALTGKVSARAYSVLVWIALRRKDPSITLDQVRAMKLSEMPRLKVIADEPDPIDAAG